MKIIKSYGIYIVLALMVIGAGIYSFKKNAPASVAVSTGNSKLDQSIQSYETKYSANPKDVKNLLALASAFIQKTRETADVAYYVKIDTLMDQAQTEDPNNADIYATRGIVALGRHNFADGLYLGQKSLALNPNRYTYYGIISDAQRELGMYDEATASLQTMVDKKPDYSSYSRISYMREIYGDIPGAETAIATATQAGSSFPENVAWGFVELGKLKARNDIPGAEEQFTQALNTVPNYPPALQNLGKVAFAKKDYEEAKRLFQQAFDILPIAEYATDLGDTDLKLGDKTKASQKYALAQVAFDRSKLSGVNTDLERALFLADHDLDLPLAKELADKAYKARPSIYGADMMAWVLYKNGDSVGAQDFTNKALKLGEMMRLFFFTQE